MPLAAANLLSEETSPYLTQHKDNPVHWRAWSAEALAEAQELDRPILLSVGYAACHWCHVMAHESFEDHEVADVMNRLFVNIKVDREERPDIDQIYMAALNATGEQGGWPLTMFLTPEGKPFWGGTYFPKLPRYGRPGFIQVLQSVDRAWQGKRGELARSANALTDHVATRLASSTAPTTLDHGQLTTLAAGVQGMIDQQRGGLRGAPKFPNAPFIRVLWQDCLTSGNQKHRDSVLISLRKMLMGGIYDHIGGGLSRYSTDADWLVPHFEKMLYDNAQLLQSVGWAYAATKEELFRARIEETVDWLLREMRVDGGGFASSLDADSEGEEGLFYTWDRSEVESILAEDTERFLSLYDLGAPQEWEGKPILHVDTTIKDLAPIFSAEFVSYRHRLFEARAGRVRPGRDDKVLVDWNGLTIAALAQVGRLLGRDGWIRAAAAAYRFVVESSDQHGRLPHSILGKRRLYPAMSSDYAAMITASVALYQATADAAYIVTARNLSDKLQSWYADQTGDGHYLSASDSSDLVMRIRGDVDEAIPSATAQVVEALTLLSSLTGDPDIHARAWAAAESASGRAAQLAYGQAGIVYASALTLDPWKLVTVDAPDTRQFAAIADATPDPRRVDIQATVGDTTSVAALPGGVVPDISRPGAWLCRGNTCLPVITDPAQLRTELIRQ